MTSHAPSEREQPLHVYTTLPRRLEIVDHRLVEVVDAEEDVAMSILPSAKVGEVLVSRDPGPGVEARDGRRVLRLEGVQLKIPPAWGQHELTDALRGLMGVGGSSETSLICC